MHSLFILPSQNKLIAFLLHCKTAHVLMEKILIILKKKVLYNGIDNCETIIATCTVLPAKSDSDFIFVYKVIRDS